MLSYLINENKPLWTLFITRNIGLFFNFIYADLNSNLNVIC